MLVAIALAALRLQTLGPILPPQCSPTFQNLVFSIEQSLQNGDFAGAAKQAGLLPKLTISYQWVDTKVPEAYRKAFRKAGAEAMAIWRQRNPSIQFVEQPNAQIRFSFEPVLAVRPGTNLPAAHVGFWSDDPSAPRLDYVIGLKRGSPLKQSEEIDVYDDVAYAVGQYLGVADGVFDVSVMAPTDLPRLSRAAISGTESNTVKRNLEVIRILLDAVNSQKRLLPAKPDLFLDPVSMENDLAVQGDLVEFHVQLSNRGDGPLSFRLFPDCGCVVVTEPGIVEPHSSRLVTLAVDTTNFVTNTTKHAAIYTNDPTTPVRLVTMHVKIKARYRLLSPMGDTVDVPSTGLKVPIFLVPAPGTDIDPVSATITGPLNATVSYKPWQGVLPDPEAQEGPMPRKGFKFVIDIKGDIGPGRRQATLQIFTSNSAFPDIAYSINAQKGIIALPEQVFMGTVGKAPKTVRFSLTRPGKPFSILAVKTNSPNLKASVVPGSDKNAYSIEVVYDGKGHSGELMASVRIHTNDPRQPYLDIPVRANIL